MSDKPLPIPSKLAYGFGSVAFGIKDSGFKTLLLIYYNQVIGLPAHLVAGVVMLALVLDALLDPFIGHISDNWRSAWGRRHPFMYAAALPSAVCFYLLWNPPAGLSQEGLLAYLLVMAIVVRSFITVYEIPSAALVSELTHNYDQRTALMSYRYFFFFFGGVILSFLTFRVFLQPDALHPVGQLNPAGYHKYSVVAAVVMFSAVVLSALGTHRRIPDFHKPPARSQPLSVAQMLGEMFETFRHRSFLMVTLAGLCKSMAIGVSGALAVYMNTYFWELRPNEIAVLFLDTLFAAALAFGLTKRISARFGKRETAATFYVLSCAIAAAPVALRLTGLWFDNDSPWLVPALFINGIMYGSIGISATIIAQSMIADCVEDSQRRTGRRSEGLLFSAGSIISKAISGMGVFIAGVILAIVQFPQDAKPGQVDADVIRGLALAYLPVVATLYALGVAAMLAYRIDRRKHEENLEVLGLAAATKEADVAP